MTKISDFSISAQLPNFEKIQSQPEAFEYKGLPAFLRLSNYTKQMPKRLKNDSHRAERFQVLYEAERERHERRKRKDRRSSSRRSRACQQLHSSTYEVCENGRWIIQRKIEDNKIIYRRLYIPCNSWSCSVCSARKKRLYYKRLVASLKTGNWWFLTCTLRKNNCSLEENWKRINSAWNTLRNRLKRIQPDLKFFRVTELQSNNMPHIHAIINVWLPKNWSHNVWHRITKDSFMCDFEFIRSNAASYIFKYFLKGTEDIKIIRAETGKKTRLYNSTRCFFLITKSEKGWEFIGFAKTLLEVDQFFEVLSESFPPRQERASPIVSVYDSEGISFIEFLVSDLYTDGLVHETFLEHKGAAPLARVLGESAKQLSFQWYY